MSYCPTASNALEHDTARRLESMESASSARTPHDAAPATAPHHDTPQLRDRTLLDRSLRDRGPSDRSLLDTDRLLQRRTTAMAAAAPGADRPDQPIDGDTCDAATTDDHAFERAPDPARDPAREALERTCLTVKRIALDIGMPRATLEAYRLGTRRMPQGARVRLGTYLASHAAMLDGLAQALIAPAKVADA